MTLEREAFDDKHFSADKHTVTHFVELTGVFNVEMNRLYS